ncbi:MAG TPA: hypothetical protein VE133_08590 [Candidatus Sulfotelmatobacter sp.]|nr:hypothetical protein [Candidatus Sulfotelmatobacter sp.]
MSKSVYCALLFLLTACGACLAQSNQPSLGDIAREHRGEKKTAKTFTNEDVSTTHPSASNDSPSSASAAAASSTASTSPGKADAKADTRKSEPAAAASKDSAEVAELKSKISSYKAEQDGWKRSAKRYEGLLANETSDFRRQMYQDAMEGDKNNIQVYQNKIDQAQADLAQAQKGSQSGH